MQNASSFARVPRRKKFHLAPLVFLLFIPALGDAQTAVPNAASPGAPASNAQAVPNVPSPPPLGLTPAPPPVEVVPTPDPLAPDVPRAPSLDAPAAEDDGFEPDFGAADPTTRFSVIETYVPGVMSLTYVRDNFTGLCLIVTVEGNTAVDQGCVYFRRAQTASASGG